MPRNRPKPRPDPLGDPQTVGLSQVTAVEANQAADVFSVEYKDSRRLGEDLQRGTIVHTYIISGRPDQVAANQLLGGIQMGDPHPWQPSAYVVGLTFDHHVFGPDPDTDTNTPGAARDSKAYTKMRVTYQQRPCPGKWEDEGGSALISRIEWFDRGDPPKPLKDTRDGVSILVPVETYKRHFPKVFLKRSELRTIKREIGKTNRGTGGADTTDPWNGEKPGFWLLEQVKHRLLYGDPDTGPAAYELTLIWRGDPERHHEWWWPKFDKGENETLRPKAPTGNTRALRRAAMDARTIYDPSDLDWDTFVPLRQTLCDPPIPAEPAS